MKLRTELKIDELMVIKIEDLENYFESKLKIIKDFAQNQNSTQFSISMRIVFS